jgi:hypothetical protein
MAIAGLWGSMFSRYGRKLWLRLPRKLWHRVVVNVGEAVAPEQGKPEELREDVVALYRAALAGAEVVNDSPRGVDRRRSTHANDHYLERAGDRCRARRRLSVRGRNRKLHVGRDQVHLARIGIESHGART